MSDYTLYYWSVPFRGQFVRAVLAHAGKIWDEAGDGAIAKLMEGPIKKMPVPFMGPPLLIDHKRDFAIAQMPAIVLYLGETLDLLPDTPERRALTMKIVCDANDMIDEITLNGGEKMWTQKRWKEFVPRLKKWMSFWEETGRRHGLKTNSGFLLGGNKPGIADVVTATLWETMTDRFRTIGTIFKRTAPMTAALTQRMAETPPLAALAAKAREDYGDAYCGGQIEKSLRKVLRLKRRHPQEQHPVHIWRGRAVGPVCNRHHDHTERLRRFLKLSIQHRWRAGQIRAPGRGRRAGKIEHQMRYPVVRMVVQKLLLRQHVGHRAGFERRQRMLVDAVLDCGRHLGLGAACQHQFRAPDRKGKNGANGSRVVTQGPAHMRIPELRKIVIRHPAALHGANEAVAAFDRRVVAVRRQHQYRCLIRDGRRRGTFRQGDLVGASHHVPIDRRHRRIGRGVGLCRACQNGAESCRRP